MALGLGFLTPAALTKLTAPHPVALAETVDSQVTEDVAGTLEVVVLKNPTPQEAKVLEVLQARGITDPAALATIMGNIKQESRFITNICEGGARVPYQGCLVGGYGLIQWTTPSRYDGLGHHARMLGLNPSSFEAQLSWLFQEKQWLDVEHKFKEGGKSVDQYMRYAYRWLGWGVHGARSHYSFDYLKRMEVVEVPASEHPTSKFTANHHYLK